MQLMHSVFLTCHFNALVYGSYIKFSTREKSTYFFMHLLHKEGNITTYLICNLDIQSNISQYLPLTGGINRQGILFVAFCYVISNISFRFTEIIKCNAALLNVLQHCFQREKNSEKSEVQEACLPVLQCNCFQFTQTLKNTAPSRSKG